ncbi:hypothetical protein KMZ68_23315 [Bradyrhizobium sediminis]|uniref:Uncharacterized protein n=1 Tax=Bradyrhizobium sediminis TaxID=2840469 RepID=A0A975NNL6_9BRAD|nr:hypothetical protein [Bradyrhizobium sediminis]QWG17846.1 hypothetical protein KMZ68_23315 [Bradyrhizobium sediminis]
MAIHFDGRRPANIRDDAFKNGADVFKKRVQKHIYGRWLITPETKLACARPNECFFA